jgi:DNA-binding NarL/FixJ family response regulator
MCLPAVVVTPEGSRGETTEPAIPSVSKVTMESAKHQSNSTNGDGSMLTQRPMSGDGRPIERRRSMDSGHIGETISVAILDDNRLVRDGLSAMLDRLPDMQVVASMAAYSPSLAETPAHVLLLDVGLLEQESLRVAIALRAEMPDTKIIVMDLIPVHDEIMDFVNAGVCGFVLKDATLDEFVATIRSVASGEKVLPPRMTESLFSQIVNDASGRRDDAKDDVLDDVRMTRREREVIELIGEGLSNKEIAQRLNIAAHTVKSHVRNVMEKLALHTRLQIAAYSHR